MKDARGVEHWMLVEGGKDDRPDVPYASRFESLGLKLPERRLTTRELLESAAHHPHIDLEALTGIRERRVCSDGEDSFTLAVAAARDCLAHSRHRPEDIEMLISASISKYKGGLRQQLEPPLSLAIKREIGARRGQELRSVERLRGHAHRRVRPERLHPPRGHPLRHGRERRVHLEPRSGMRRVRFAPS